MKLVMPSIKVLRLTPNPLLLIESAGRVCYKSEDRITDDSASPFVRSLIKRGHESVLEHASATVRVICDRGVTHEIVRHRIASYSQESTRYCNYGKSVVRFVHPSDFDLDEDDISLLQAIEAHYNKCLDAGRSPQQARYFLPNGLRTEIVMTMNFREWRHFFRLRCAAAAHPDMRVIAGLIRRELSRLVPVVFDDLEV